MDLGTVGSVMIGLGFVTAGLLALWLLVMAGYWVYDTAADWRADRRWRREFNQAIKEGLELQRAIRPHTYYLYRRDGSYLGIATARDAREDYEEGE